MLKDCTLQNLFKKCKILKAYEKNTFNLVLSSVMEFLR
jgi:hypothetical protein